MRTILSLSMLLSAFLASACSGSGATAPGGDAGDSVAAGAATSGVDGGTTAEEQVPTDAGATADDAASEESGWWSADVAADATAPDSLQGTEGGGKDDEGGKGSLTLEECIEECLQKGGQSQEGCEAACAEYVAGEGGGGGKDDDKGDEGDGKDDEGGDGEGLDQDCYDACIANEAKDEAACAAYCSGDSGDGAGDDEGGGLPEAVPCPDDFDPSEPCEGDPVETACLVGETWYWCADGAWTNEK